MGRWRAVWAVVIGGLMVVANAFAAELPFQPVGFTAPARAANGFPFTYTVQVTFDKNKTTLAELAERLWIDAEFTNGKNALRPHGPIYIFPLAEGRGLVQYLFMLPENFPRAQLLFRGRLIYRHDDDSAEVIALPERELETGGPWNQPPAIMI